MTQSSTAHGSSHLSPMSPLMGLAPVAFMTHSDAAPYISSGITESPGSSSSSLARWVTQWLTSVALGMSPSFPHVVRFIEDTDDSEGDMDGTDIKDEASGNSLSPSRIPLRTRNGRTTHAPISNLSGQQGTTGGSSIFASDIDPQSSGYFSEIPADWVSSEPPVAYEVGPPPLLGGGTNTIPLPYVDPPVFWGGTYSVIAPLFFNAWLVNLYDKAGMLLGQESLFIPSLAPGVLTPPMSPVLGFGTLRQLPSTPEYEESSLLFSPLDTLPDTADFGHDHEAQDYTTDWIASQDQVAWQPANDQRELVEALRGSMASMTWVLCFVFLASEVFPAVLFFARLAVTALAIMAFFLPKRM